MTQKHRHYRSDLKRVRGLGAAHDGTSSFWLERITSLALIPLCVWFMVQFVTLLVGAERSSAAHWFQNPLNGLFAAMFVGAMFMHARLGVQVIIEDYVHNEAMKYALLILNRTLMLVFGLASLVAIVRLHFLGMA